MSMFGPMKNSSALHFALPAGPDDDHRRVERDERRRRVGRAHGDAAVGAPEAMLAILPFGRIGVAGVAAGAIAIDAVAVVPAARVLADVAADRAGVSDLRARDAARRIGQHLVAALDDASCARSPSASSTRRSRRRRPAVSRMPLSAAMPPRSTTYFGRFTRSLNQSKLSLPPASAQPSAPKRPRSSTAPSTVSGWYSSNALIMSLDIAKAP